MQNNVLDDSDKVFQQRLLHGVARTFALTIPQLPPELADTVANAYLLCRIADTIEDEAAIESTQKPALAKSYIDAVTGRAPAREFIDAFYPRLGPGRLAAERELIAQTDKVLRITHAFPESRRALLERCVSIMTKGMIYFQLRKSGQGLPDLREFDRYCYHVAGVVGELLTELYCQRNAELAARRGELLRLAVSFGQGLQMTNILRDIGKDLERGACWLPRDLFDTRGFELTGLNRESHDPAFADGVQRLIAIAHGHLRNALSYTLLLPVRERGLRKFCYGAIAMALLTLRKIRRRPYLSLAGPVKIRRAAVGFVFVATTLLQHSNGLLRWLFNRLAAGLPPAADAGAPADPHAPVRAWFDSQA